MCTFDEVFLHLYFYVWSNQAGSSKAKEVGSGMLVEHSGRAPRLEMVSFKKLNKGTLALGVVFKVRDSLDQIDHQPYS